MQHLSGMSEEEQRHILRIARSVSAESGDGVSGSSLLRFAGTISLDDARQMSAAIEEGCEQIDPKEW
jgi:hypothetical protein